MTTSTDRIEKHFDIDAPRSRVWRALSDAQEFGTWFGIELEKPFASGTTVHGRVTNKGFEHITLEMRIEQVKPEEFFSYRWHPAAIDPSIDYAAEPMTLVEFHLAEHGNKTSVTIIESGFDALPASRRAEAFRMNDGGWTSQSKRLATYAAG